MTAYTNQQDVVSDLIAFEEGELDQEEVVALFQRLIDNGMAWSLQGSYGRTASRLIEAGYCQPPGYAEVAWGQHFG